MLGCDNGGGLFEYVSGMMTPLVGLFAVGIPDVVRDNSRGERRNADVILCGVGRQVG